MNEFELIHRYFNNSNQDSSVIHGIGDDAAIIKPSKNYDLVMSVDTLLEDVHFPSTMPPQDIGYRCVAVNISDMAAMGAIPRWLTLALSLPEFNEKWLEKFSIGLFTALEEYKVTLVGGDTTSGKQLTLTASITGEVKSDSAITRAGASVGDLIFITGTIGDAAAGLGLIGDTEDSSEDEKFLIERFARPSARSHIGQALVNIASAAIDVSDGLFADTKKLLDASLVGGSININDIPFSRSLINLFSQKERQQYALNGGDDYELLFTVPVTKIHELDKIKNTSGISITQIGAVSEADGLECILDNKKIEYDHGGYLHFS